MVTMIAWGFVITLVIAVSLVVIYRYSSWFDDWSKGAVVCLVAVVTISGATSTLVSTHVGVQISIDEQLTYKEFWNGYEKNALSKNQTCTRDGFCKHTYECDPYVVIVTRTVSSVDSKGQTTTRTESVPETRWHSCPYSKQETSYAVDTTLGKFSYGDNLMTGEPYRADHPIPGGQQSDPGLWVNAKKRIEAGNPEGVTKTADYKNYLLATENLYAKHSSEVAELKDKSLLPSLARSASKAGKVSKFYNPTRLNLSGTDRYVGDVQAVNGALGVDKMQGDLHVVMVDKDVETGPDKYANAVMAYWMDDKEFGRNALAKNTIVVVLGVDQQKRVVDWSRAFTGMPMGNEALMLDLRDQLRQVPVDEHLIGHPTYDVKSRKVTASNGKIESLLWGEHKFERVSMAGDGDESKGFGYLKSGIEPTLPVSIATVFVNGILILGFMVLAFFLIPKYREWAHPTSRSRTHRQFPSQRRSSVVVRSDQKKVGMKRSKNRLKSFTDRPNRR